MCVADPSPVDMSAVPVVALVVQQSENAEICEFKYEAKGLHHHGSLRPVVALWLLRWMHEPIADADNDSGPVSVGLVASTGALVKESQFAWNSDGDSGPFQQSAYSFVGRHCRLEFGGVVGAFGCPTEHLQRCHRSRDRGVERIGRLEWIVMRIARRSTRRQNGSCASVM